MHPSIVMEYIKTRIRELGLGEEYVIRFKHIPVPPTGNLTLRTAKDFFVIIDMPEDLRIESERGVYDLSDQNLSEIEYEHRGTIQITNLYNFFNHLKMIHVIPN